MEENIRLALMELGSEVDGISFKNLSLFLKESYGIKVSATRIKKAFSNGLCCRDMGWGNGDGVLYRIPPKDDRRSVKKHTLSGQVCPRCGGNVSRPT
jgi:hypothetical protein